jgi:hypothetical protein
MTLALHAVMADLDRADNIFGALKPDLRARLFAAIDEPTQAHWEDARSIVISTTGHIAGQTFWQAVLAHTNYTDWRTVPTVEQMTHALALATR